MSDQHPSESPQQDAQASVEPTVDSPLTQDVTQEQPKPSAEDQAPASETAQQPAEQAVAGASAPQEQAAAAQEPAPEQEAAQAAGSSPAEEPASSAPAQDSPAPAAPSAPKPGAPKPGKPSAAGARQGKPAAAAAPAPLADVHTSLEEARKFARVTDDGHVFVIVDGTELAVGQYPDASADEALAYFVRKHDDVLAQVMLLEQRVVAKAPASDMPKTLDSIEATVKERAMVGDLAALEARVENLRVAVENLRDEERRNAEQLRAAALEAREAIVAEAETLAGKPPAQVQWKQASARMAELFDAWKEAQKSGHRIGRATEDALWKRFRGARTTFDRHRRAFFSKLDADNSDAKAQKEALIARAEALQSSTEWRETAVEYRKLMDEWKASKRASRRDDDALWQRFRAAQDVFFNARKAANDEIDREFAANLVVKEDLLKEAKALLPVKNLASAQKALNDIRDRWEAAGKVPRGDLQRIESGLRQVEDAVKSAEDEQWRRSNPETKARSNSMLTQLEDAIAELEADVAKAEASGDAKRLAKAKDALAARQQWLETVRRSAADLG